MHSDPFYRLSIFHGMTAAQISHLRSLFISCDFCDEAVLFEQGDVAEFLYIVVDGEVVVAFKPDDGPPITVARVGPGGVVGWSAALGSRMYTSGALCSTNTQLLRVRGTDLRKLCEQHTDTGVILLERLATVIAERLTNTHEQVLGLLEQGLKNGEQGTGG